MARPWIYSRSPARAVGPAPTAAALPTRLNASPTAAVGDQPAAAADLAPEAAAPLTFVQRLRRRERWLWATALLLAFTAAGWPAWTVKAKRPLSIEQIDAALRDAFAKEPLQSPGLAAYEAILPSVVRVVGDMATPATDTPGKPAKRGKPPTDEADPHEGRSVGTGVVIVDKGLILTNLHVVQGAAKITVTFSDGSESEARVVNVMPENDLAVLQALTIPDDLHAATMRSTSGLGAGEAVLAVGFPFGIGPSASQGVVSGLKREFRSPEGKRILTNLIQFDAAANPGNSGGPLVTMDGQVVGIVTAIMNPSQQRTFIGIGFAVPIENAAAGAGLPPF